MSEDFGSVSDWVPGAIKFLIFFLDSSVDISLNLSEFELKAKHPTLKTNTIFKDTYKKSKLHSLTQLQIFAVNKISTSWAWCIITPKKAAEICAIFYVNLHNLRLFKKKKKQKRKQESINRRTKRVRKERIENRKIFYDWNFHSIQ